MKTVLSAACLLLILFGEAKAQKISADAFIPGTAYSSPFGKRTKIVLPDQTIAVLNSGTSIWLDKNFGKADRRLRISGDALFSIKKNSRVFVIYSQHLTITANEAVARINAFSDEAGAEAAVLSGKLRAVKSYYSALDHDPYSLSAGEMVMMNRDIDLMEKENADMQELKAWISDQLILQNASLSDFTRKLESWYSVRISIQGKVKSDLRYTGRFDRAGLQEVLAAVGNYWKFRYRAQGNHVTLTF